MKSGRFVLGLLLALFVAHGSASRAMPQTRAPKVRSARLYMFDCGTLERGEPTAYGLTRAQVGSTDFSDPCYLVVHPRGTLLWDVGILRMRYVCRPELTCPGMDKGRARVHRR